MHCLSLQKVFIRLLDRFAGLATWYIKLWFCSEKRKELPSSSNIFFPSNNTKGFELSSKGCFCCC